MGWMGRGRDYKQIQLERCVGINMQNYEFSSCPQRDSKLDNQTDTSKDPCNPRPLQRAYTLPSHCKDHSDSAHSTHLSFTEQQIHSHPIIRNLLFNCRNKVVCHHINQIPPHTELYSRPASKDAKSKGSEAAVGMEKKGMVGDEEVYAQIANETPIWLKIKQSSASQSHRLIVRQKTASLPHKKMRNVNISALTTYNFTSVKARFRIAFDPAGTEQELSITMAAAKEKAQQAIKRGEKIRRRTDPDLAKNQGEIERAITENYPELSTTQYLQALHREKHNSKVIFGEKASSFDMMRKSMQSVRDQEQAEFLINAIKLTSRPLPKHKPVGSFRPKAQNRTNESQMLRGRRQAARGKQVVISYIPSE